jgi:hypothetical protein
VWRSAWWVVVIGGVCCEWLGGRVVLAVITDWFGVVNPTRGVGCVGRLGIVFPLTPRFPLVGGVLVVVVVV